MRRFSVRLTQLQDIGGNRVIVDTNADVEALRRFLLDRIARDRSLDLHRETDYRVEGRDDTGYRALHMIFDREGLKIELQLRSRAQHHWAESIETTSVIYGQHLKENEGHLARIGVLQAPLACVLRTGMRERTLAPRENGFG